MKVKILLLIAVEFILLFIIFILLPAQFVHTHFGILAALGFLKYFPKKAQPNTNQIITPSLKSTQKPAPTSSPSPTFLKKKDLTIRILNGSGIPGLAATTKEKLASIGFTHIETGNAQENAEETIATFSAVVSNDVKGEITQELKKTFENVVTKENGSQYDIDITTGKTL